MEEKREASRGEDAGGNGGGAPPPYWHILSSYPDSRSVNTQLASVAMVPRSMQTWIAGLVGLACWPRVGTPCRRTRAVGFELDA